MIGWTYAFTTVVLVRSYSRHSWVIRCDAETATPGSSRATISAARCSWDGSRYENRNTIATDSTPSAASWRAAARTASSSSATSTSPVAVRRPGTSRQRPRGTRGTGRR